MVPNLVRSAIAGKNINGRAVVVRSTFHIQAFTVDSDRAVAVTGPILPGVRPVAREYIDRCAVSSAVLIVVEAHYLPVAILEIRSKQTGDARRRRSVSVAQLKIHDADQADCDHD